MLQAFRTLKLLEEHHTRLSQILKSQVSSPSQTKPEQATEKVTAHTSPSVANPQAVAGSQYRPETQSFAAAHRPSRDAGSSIASNLASARGIPANKQRRSGQVSSTALAQQHAEGKILNPQRQPKATTSLTKSTTEATQLSEKVSLASQNAAALSQDVTMTGEGKPEQTGSAANKSDDAFNRFYTTFESLFSKLSAPLAFAGLPLNPDSETSTPPPPTEVPQSQQSPRHQSRNKPRPTTRPSSRATVEPEYSRLFSPAALAAVREEPGGSNLGAAESFYVVPTTGGTMQYASILARHQNQQQSHNNKQQGLNHHRTVSRESTGLSEDLDEFVDARETLGPPSPLDARRSGGGKSMEELQLENESLRAVLDEMSRRLWQFEMGAQMGSVALQQSIRASLNRTNTAIASPSASQAGGALAGPGDAKGLEVKVVGLEEEVGKAKKELERMGRENEKLKGVVGRYRERWEKLKEGARTRRGGGAAGTDVGGPGVGGMEQVPENAEV